MREAYRLQADSAESSETWELPKNGPETLRHEAVRGLVG
jgi:hypothetical protein